MANNKLTDLNNHLFASLERLSCEELKGDDLKEEITRAKSINDVSKQIVSNAKLTLDAAKLVASGQLAGGSLPELIDAGKLKAMDH
tara:strand:- start:1348 stop:1605 length:258 start_codon:yes stop_codon:yes gene_type:complete